MQSPASQFLSTLSLRRATNINSSVNTADKISIHALLAESDRLLNSSWISSIKFLSTLSLRRATVGVFSCYLDNIISIHALLAESDTHPVTVFICIIISIHALLAESDCSAGSGFCRPRYFYPRSPCGERLKLFAKRFSNSLFLSTLSLRRATTDMRQRLIEFRFLSTLSLRRATMG